MKQSIFTVVFLLISLLVVNKIKSFIANNRTPINKEGVVINNYSNTNNSTASSVDTLNTSDQNAGMDNKASSTDNGISTSTNESDVIENTSIDQNSATTSSRVDSL